MDRGRVNVRMARGPEWTAVANALREVDAALPTWLRKELKKAAKPLVAEAKRNIRMLPVRGHGHTGLRRKVARGIVVKAGVGRNPYLRVVTTMSDSNEAVIPRGFTRTQGWRHPVWGSNTWVRQEPLVQWDFVDTFKDGRDDIRDALRDVLERAAQKIDDAGNV